MLWCPSRVPANGCLQRLGELWGTRFPEALTTSPSRLEAAAGEAERNVCGDAGPLYFTGA